MATPQNNEQAIRHCVALFNQCSLEWVDTCYAEAAEWTELPIPGMTRGRQGDRAFLRLSAGNVLRLYPDRQLRVLNLVAQADQVVLEQDWQGTTAADYASVKAGTVVRFQVASFFTLADGLIVRQTDYVIPMPVIGR